MSNSPSEPVAAQARLLAQRQLLLRKGHEVATALGALLAGKEVDLLSLTRSADASGNPALRLRAFLARIDRAIKGRFGVCRVCEAALSPLALDETPWLDRCALHPE